RRQDGRAGVTRAAAAWRRRDRSPVWPARAPERRRPWYAGGGDAARQAVRVARRDVVLVERARLAAKIGERGVVRGRLVAELCHRMAPDRLGALRVEERLQRLVGRLLRE